MTAFKIYPDEQAPTLDQLLNEQGYEIEGESNVMTCPIQSGLAPESIGFKAETELSDWWLDAAAALNGISDGKRPYLRQILQNIQPTHAFASFRDGNEPVAVGLAVAEREWVGLFDIVTAKSKRRLGHGRNLVLNLMDWGFQQGAKNAYLQVMSNNKPAIDLYRGLGFEPRYTYWYRVRS
jgi:ribosomal protein S18 acetylase RimI-like enzyme